MAEGPWGRDWVLPLVPAAADQPWCRAPCARLAAIGVPRPVTVRWAKERRTITPAALRRKAAATRN